MDGKVGKDLSRDEGTKRPAGQERFIYLAAAAEIRVCDDREGRQSVAAQPTKDSRCARRKRWTVRSARICEEAKVPNGQQDKNDLLTSPRPRKSATRPALLVQQVLYSAIHNTLVHATQIDQLSFSSRWHPKKHELCGCG